MPRKIEVNKNNCLSTVNPKLTAEWHPIKNGELNPNIIRCNDCRIVWWECGRYPEHEWSAGVRDRNRGNNCPFCANLATSLRLSKRPKFQF